VFYKLVEEYSNIISDYSVSDFRRYGAASSLAAKIKFIDESILYIKDYLFIDGKRKYSYHWQTNKGHLISRWDNSPHHKNISTFSHHRHIQCIRPLAKQYCRLFSSQLFCKFHNQPPFFIFC